MNSRKSSFAISPSRAQGSMDGVMSLTWLILSAVLVTPVAAQEADRRREDRPTQRWLPLPKIQPNEVGEHQAQLLHMLGQLMSPGNEGSGAQNSAAQGLSEDQLNSIEKTFEAWNNSTGGKFPSLDSIPEEWIQEAMQNQELQSRARRLLDEYSKTRKLPANHSDSSSKQETNKTYDDLLKQFQQRDSSSTNSRESAATNPTSGTNTQSGSNRLRPATPPQERPSQSDPIPEIGSGFFPNDSGNDLPQNGSPSSSRSGISNESSRDESPTLDSDQSLTDRSNRARESGRRIRSQSDPQQTTQPPDLSRGRSNNSPFERNANSEPSSSLPDSRSGVGRQSQSAPSNLQNRYLPNSNQSLRNSDLPSPSGSVGRRQGSETGRTSPTGNADTTDRGALPLELDDEMRQQLRSLFEQLAQQGALPSTSNSPAQTNSRSPTKDPQNAGLPSTSPRTSTARTPNRSGRTSNDERGQGGNQRSQQASSRSRPNSTPATSSGLGDRNQPSRQRLSELLRNNLRNDTSDPTPTSQSGTNLPSESIARRGSASESPAEPIDLEELFSDESLSHLWDESNSQKPSTGTSGSQNGFTPGDMNDLLEAAKQVRNSDLGRKIQQQFSNSGKPNEPSSASGGTSASGPDIKSQVERFGFGRTLKGIVEKTLKDEGLKDGESIFSSQSKAATGKSDSSARNDTSKFANNASQTQRESSPRKQSPKSELTRNRPQKSKKKGEKSTLEKLSDSFWAKPENDKQSRSESPARESKASQNEAVSGSSPFSLEGWSWQMGSTQWIVLVGICLLLLTAWLLRTQVMGQAVALKKEVRWAKEKLRTGMTSRQDVVRAYHSLVLNRTAPASRWWTHRYVERKLSETLPQLQKSLRELTQVYELARYQPPELELHSDQLASVQSALRELEAAGT